MNQIILSGIQITISIWIPVRIEMDEDWYLVGLPKTSLSGLTVRM